CNSCLARSACGLAWGRAPSGAGSQQGAPSPFAWAAPAGPGSGAERQHRVGWLPAAGRQACGSGWPSHFLIQGQVAISW
ncbi:unnamed protein product, partial [Bubo scandiacus]